MKELGKDRVSMFGLYMYIILYSWYTYSIHIRLGVKYFEKTNTLKVFDTKYKYLYQECISNTYKHF